MIKEHQKEPMSPERIKAHEPTAVKREMSERIVEAEESGEPGDKPGRGGPEPGDRQKKSVGYENN
jgi:hypothetical protein